MIWDVITPEFPLAESKHPLAETIVNQTGNTKQKRIAFLNKQYQLALDSAIITWKPEIELNGNF